MQCSSSECQLLWLSQRPTIVDLHKAYRSYYTHDDGELRERKGIRFFLSRCKRVFVKSYIKCRFGYIHAGFVRIFLMELLAQLLPSGSDSLAIEGMLLPAIDQPRRLLEVGCGNGNMLKLMRELGWEVEGLEYDPKCKKLVEILGLRCSLGDIREQQYPSESFNAIYAGNVIEHVFDPVSFVKECSRVLKTGGYFVVLTPNAASFGHMYFNRDWRGLEPPRHLQLFNLRNLSKIVTDYGFELKIARTTNRGAWYILGMSTSIRKARYCGSRTAKSHIRMLSCGGLARQLLGRLIQAFLSNRGEELLLVAIKK
ncbi:MAG: class I SAM-dependent methyltransferase [Desulfuromonadales bacterium]|nr:class I SAM-dependent methyltransferase [Desulfuromonadales bacterium]